jgi:hypothetical protein
MYPWRRIGLFQALTVGYQRKEGDSGDAPSWPDRCAGPPGVCRMPGIAARYRCAVKIDFGIMPWMPLVPSTTCVTW